MPGIFLFSLQEHVAIGHLVGAFATVEVEIVDAVDALHIHRETLEPVGQFAGDRRAFDARDLLKIRELADFHAVAPAFPAETPGAECRALPVVLDEADIMQAGIKTDRGERLQVQILKVRRRWLHDHLKLVIMLQPVRVFAVAAVLWPARGLHIGGPPRFRPERAQGRRRMKGARAHFHVVGLQDHAALFGPEPLQSENEALERTFRAHMGRQFVHRQNRSREGVCRRAGPYRRWRGESRRWRGLP